MDDNTFDDIIKNKVGDFQAQEYDPAALADLHYRMASQHSIPWYSQYRGEIWVAATSAVIAMILLWGQWRIGNAENQLLKTQIAQLKNEQIELQSMKDMLSRLSTAPDTVRIVQNREANLYLYENLLNEIEALKSQVAKNASPLSRDLRSEAQLVYLGEQGTLPNDVMDQLKKDGPIVKRGKHLFLLASNNINTDKSPWLARRKGISSELVLPEYRFVIDTSHAQEDIVASKVIKKPVEISIKQMREIEKHYKKGIGLKIGPSIESYNGRYSIGDTEQGWGGGIIADFILSPSLSIETGMVLHGRMYDTERLEDLHLPPRDPQLGEFEKLEVTSRLFEVPFNFKYRYPLSLRSNVVTSLGISGLLYTYQNVEYLYEFDAGNDIKFAVESSFHKDEPRWSVGTLNASLGLNRELKNKKEVEVSLFYKYGLSEMGLEQVNADFFGIRAAYLFTVKK